MKHHVPEVNKGRARRMRKEMTEAEVYLWLELRQRRLGVKFRRQVPIGRYIVDFACLERRVIVEVDGSHHRGPYDQERDRWLRSQGFVILRFWNDDIVHALGWVLDEIVNALEVAEARLA